MISNILKDEGYSVSIAYDGEAAVAKIKKYPYDVMVLDYKLFRMSGLEVLEKACQIRPLIKTIMISAYGDSFTKARAKELGAYYFLDKPFNINRLIRTVKNILVKKTGMRLTAPRTLKSGIKKRKEV